MGEVGSGKWEMGIGNSMASTILTFYLHPRLEGVRVPMVDRLLEGVLCFRQGRWKLLYLACPCTEVHTCTVP
jgi:hypothetical protein